MNPMSPAGAVQLRVGSEMTYECAQPTPMILMTSIHFSRVSDIVSPDHIVVVPAAKTRGYRDSFGNWCTRIVAPPGRVTITTSAVVRDAGALDVIEPSARQAEVDDLPEDALVYLMGSRYCETDRLSDVAWSLFGQSPSGWARAQTICDYVHRHVTFGYEHARSTKSAVEVFHEKKGVCRDYAHLAVTFCRAMNIPARYCTGYLTDIGVPPPHGPMDFAAWLEVYLDGRWFTLDPRNNAQRVGRVLIARGRDAADVPIANTFGPAKLEAFRVWADELAADGSADST